MQITDLTNRIFCADSHEFLRKIPDSSIDIILTSPPYNFGMDYKNGSSDSLDWSEYFKKLNSIWVHCKRLLADGGRLIVNVQPLFSDYIPSHHVISSQLMTLGLLWKGEILWEKNNYNCKYTAWGSWCSPSMPYLKYTWEFVEIFCNGSLRKPGAKENADILPDEFKEWVNARWSIAPEHGVKKFGHPAVMPEKLAERLLKLFSFPGDIILDPFNGVGTTTLSAHRTGRRYIGVDVSPEYCTTAEERIESARAEHPLFEAMT